MPAASWAIQIVFEGQCYKVCRIWFGSDGSYYVTAPYHKDRSAAAAIVTAFYERRRSMTSRESYVDVGLLEDDERRLKLSHHPDGFVQFSGEGILSGIDEHGSPRGIGIHSFPLSRPPRTGPSFACALVGLSDFEVGNAGRRDAVNFDDRAIPPLSTARGWILEGSYFPSPWRQYIFSIGGDFFIEMRHNMGAIIRYRILLDQSDLQGFIGLRIFRADVGVGEAESGFILSGPSTNVRTVDGERIADGLSCMYPTVVDVADPMRSLKFETQRVDES